MEREICAARIRVEHQNTVKKARIYCQLQTGGQWDEIEAKVDSGADSTIGSIQKHERLCRSTWKPVGHVSFVRKAAGHRVSVSKKGLIKLRIEDKKLQLAEILLVDAPEWGSLLIGEDLLQDQGMSVQAIPANQNNLSSEKKNN